MNDPHGRGEKAFELELPEKLARLVEKAREVEAPAEGLARVQARLSATVGVPGGGDGGGTDGGQGPEMNEAGGAGGTGTGGGGVTLVEQAAGATAGVSQAAAGSGGVATALAGLLQPATIAVFVAGAVAGSGVTAMVTLPDRSSSGGEGTDIARAEPLSAEARGSERIDVEEGASETGTSSHVETGTSSHVETGASSHVETVLVDEEASMGGDFETESAPLHAPARLAGHIGTSAAVVEEPEVSPPQETTTSVKEEQALIEMARMALIRKRPHAALEHLASHADRYPDGSLAEERDALSCAALSRAGRADEARAAAESFEARYPASILLPMVKAAASHEPPASESDADDGAAPRAISPRPSNR